MEYTTEGRIKAYRNWILASRPWSFTMTAISVSVGAGLAAVEGDFSWGLYLITLLGMTALHAGTNMSNDYFDVRSGVDTLEVSTAQYRPHPLLEGKLDFPQMRLVFCTLYLAAGTAGLYLAATRGWEILFIGCFGVFASLMYTAPPLKYKYSALGEFSVFLMWGPLMVEGAYFVQRRTFSPVAFWISLPFGVLVALVLLVNNLRDLRTDTMKGIRTLPILIGRKNGIGLYIGLLSLAYLSVVWMVISHRLSFWSLIVFLSLPIACRLFKELTTDIPKDADARTAQLNTAFGLLLVLSLVGEYLFRA